MLTNDPIAMKFWNSHNELLNITQDAREQGFDPLYPLRTMYKRYLLSILSTGNKSVIQKLTRRFENDS